MKITKQIFLISLVNFVILFGIILSTKIFTPTNTENSKTIESPSPTITFEPTPTKQITLSPSPSKIILITPTAIKTPTVNPTVAKCVIQIDGATYDITAFRKIHGGGDIFQCGTDMSAIFHGQHPDTYLDKISKYKI